ncbi:MAG: hypothetical protein JWL77_5793 [Chthonomonadaceae bacterium]|nr:hypothetical protein [Chthonomonadaceae bacterium]
MNTNDAPEVQACYHMRHHVQALADDTIKGPMRWYTQVHCSYCKQCGAALQTRREAHEANPTLTDKVV